ncbi:MAG: type III secretion system chaperone [Planctomycetota bacterium]
MSRTPTRTHTQNRTRTRLRLPFLTLAGLAALSLTVYGFGVATAHEPDAPNLAPPAPTDNAQLDAWLLAILDDPGQVQGGNGVWQFTYADETVVMMTDEQANRMRIMAPIGPAHEVNEDELVVLMAANFDRALDARYCLGRGQLWSAFIHPLGDLSAHTFADALNQVVTLKKTYGTTYSSTGVIFGQPAPPARPAEPDNPDNAI